MFWEGELFELNDDASGKQGFWTDHNKIHLKLGGLSTAGVVVWMNEATNWSIKSHESWYKSMKSYTELPYLRTTAEAPSNSWLLQKPLPIFPIFFSHTILPYSMIFQSFKCQNELCNGVLLYPLNFDRLQSFLLDIIFLAKLHWLFKHSKQKSTETGNREINLNWMHSLNVLKSKLQTLFICFFP